MILVYIEVCSDTCCGFTNGPIIRMQSQPLFMVLLIFRKLQE
jgi:hypothetical protein